MGILLDSLCPLMHACLFVHPGFEPDGFKCSQGHGFQLLAAPWLHPLSAFPSGDSLACIREELSKIVSQVYEDAAELAARTVCDLPLWVLAFLQKGGHGPPGALWSVARLRRSPALSFVLGSEWGPSLFCSVDGTCRGGRLTFTCFSWSQLAQPGGSCRTNVTSAAGLAPRPALAAGLAAAAHSCSVETSTGRCETEPWRISNRSSRDRTDAWCGRGGLGWRVWSAALEPDLSWRRNGALGLWFSVYKHLCIGHSGLFSLPGFWSVDPEVKQQCIWPVRTMNLSDLGS
ncbi:uncharacterized protein LOC131810528 [Mustela lutreola]|uniref:uncharacterized protein LOC131810528 n=1 Tax=Mustela lutreola TaxID=9666 RepID=UPI002797846D|nr:uncharacterized protein LOC131810528 [Mustela lutreola]